jgi:hypothetical protein
MRDVATPDLRPVLARHAWARGHADRVKTLVADWAANALVVDVEYDDAKNVFVHQARLAIDPPVGIALAASDVLHQARATLDNLVGVLRASPTETSGYPIAKTAESFQAQAATKLVGVPHWAVDVIARLQPFGTEGWLWVSDALWRLHGMAIIDRHRAPIIQAGILDIDQVYLATDHTGKTEFSMRHDSQVLTVETPDPHARPHLGATVLLREPLLGDDLYPFYPTVVDFTDHVVRAVGEVIAMIEREAVRQPLDPEASADD